MRTTCLFSPNGTCSHQIAGFPQSISLARLFVLMGKVGLVTGQFFVQLLRFKGGYDGLENTASARVRSRD